MIDLESRKVSGTIDVSPYPAPHGLQVDNYGKLYATVEMNRKMLVIDPVTKTIEAAIDTDGAGHWVTVLPDGSKAYVVIDTATDEIVETVDIKDNSIGPFRIRFSPDGDKLITVNDEDSLANIYDGQDLSQPQQALKVGEQPFGIAYSVDGSTALVSNHGDCTISVIDLDQMRVTRTFTAGRRIETLSYY